VPPYSRVIQPSRSSRSKRHAFPVVMESNAQPTPITVAKKKNQTQQQEELTLCGDPLFGHSWTNQHVIRMHASL